LKKIIHPSGVQCFLRSEQIVQLKELDQSDSSDIAPPLGCGSLNVSFYK